MGALYNYTKPHMTFIRRAARTAAGASDPSRQRFPPRAVFINDGNRQQMMAMMQLCFDNHFPLTKHDNGRLLKLAECLLAYLFIMLEQWVETYSRDNISVKAIIENALRVNLVHRAVDGSIDLNPLYTCGGLAWEDMKVRNSLTLVLTDADPVQQLLALAFSNQAELLAQRTMLHTLGAQMREQEKRHIDCKRALEAMSASVTQLRLTAETPPPSPRERVPAALAACLSDDPPIASQRTSSASSASSAPVPPLQLCKLGSEKVLPPFVASKETSAKTVFDALVLWRTRGLANSANVADPRDGAAQRTNAEVKAINREMGRLRLVVHVAVNLLSEEESKIWKAGQPDNAASEEWSAWYTGTQGVCRSMESKLLASIKERERVVKVAKGSNEAGTEGSDEAGTEGSNVAGTERSNVAGTVVGTVVGKVFDCVLLGSWYCSWLVVGNKVFD